MNFHAVFHHPQRPKPKKRLHVVHPTMHPHSFFSWGCFVFILPKWKFVFLSMPVPSLCVAHIFLFSKPLGLLLAFVCLQAVPIFCTLSWQTKLCQASFFSSTFSLYAPLCKVCQYPPLFTAKTWCRVCQLAKKTVRCATLR